eukprot:TRINITY_DN20997_c0_g1_i2.p1 TRINITY_DN20997_c0_g1~~TRINITY_DN20997_c0_g1_i2.p1  ORF type:complete len:376 (+),score=145.00 TRINITY_DN20997_c0_g1_i2:41-1168(+)
MRATLCVLSMAVACLCEGPQQMGGEVFAYLKTMEDRPEGSAAMVLFNAHPNFFGKCERCLELHTYFTAFVPAAREAAAAAKKRVDFVNVEYAPATERLVKELNLTVPCMFMVKSGSGAPIKFTGVGKQGSYFDPPGELSAKEQRAARRRDAMRTHAEVDELIGLGSKTLTEKTLALWLEEETGVAVDMSRMAANRSEPAQGGGGGGVSLQQVLLLVAAFVSGALFVWRTLTREAEVDSDDAVQNLVRVQSSTLLLIAHVFVMGGIHWCILNDAAPIGPNGSLFMAGRLRGQYFFEGIFVSAIVFAGAYAAFGLHRAHQLGSNSKGGPRDIVKFSLTVLGFMHLLMVMNTLHKNYWYLSDTWFRKVALGFVTARRG